MKESDERFDRRMKESDERFDRMVEDAARRQAESARIHDREMEKLRQQMGDLGVRIGNLVEHMIGGKNVIEQFQDLGYNVIDHSRNNKFGIEGTADSGQIDLLLKDGDVEILIEVKTNLKNDDVLWHAERMERYRRWMDSKGEGKKRYIGALACAMVEDNVVKFAQKNGMYVIKQLVVLSNLFFNHRQCKNQGEKQCASDCPIALYCPNFAMWFHFFPANSAFCKVDL